MLAEGGGAEMPDLLGSGWGVWDGLCLYKSTDFTHKKCNYTQTSSSCTLSRHQNHFTYEGHDCSQYVKTAVFICYGGRGEKLAIAALAVLDFQTLQAEGGGAESQTS